MSSRESMPASTRAPSAARSRRRTGTDAGFRRSARGRQLHSSFPRRRPGRRNRPHPSYPCRPSRHFHPSRRFCPSRRSRRLRQHRGLLGRAAPDLDWIEVMSNVGSANSANLVGYWNFDEAQGSIIRDASAKSSDGTLYGATQWSGDLPPKINFGSTSSLSASGSARATRSRLALPICPPPTLSSRSRLGLS